MEGKFQGKPVGYRAKQDKSIQPCTLYPYNVQQCTVLICKDVSTYLKF